MKQKCCYPAERVVEVYRFKLQSTWYITSPHFVWYGKRTIIHELRTFLYDIYPITPSPKKLDDRTQKRLLRAYTNSRAKMKWWDTHTKKFKCCLYVKNNEHNIKFGKGLPPGSVLMNSTNISTVPMIKIDFSDHIFIKYDILPAVRNKCPSFFRVSHETDVHQNWIKHRQSKLT